MSHTKSKGYKKTKTCKEIRKILMNHFPKPNYIDNITKGVSFKWYIGNFQESKHPLEYFEFRSIFSIEIYERLTFKILDGGGIPIKYSEPDWIEKVFGKRKKQIPVAFRILVNLEGAE